MPKLNAMKYITATGDRKINCYRVIISKDVVNAAGFNQEDNLKIYSQKEKIIIEKEKNE